MRIISFDVGMKNLAYCVFSISDTVAFTGASPSELIHQIQIERWDVIDLRFEPNLSGTALHNTPPPPPKRTCINDSKQAKWVAQLAQPSLVAPTAPLTSVSHQTIFGSSVGCGSVAVPSPVLYCAKCAEKSRYKIPSREILPIKRKPELLQKKKLGELMDIKANLSAAAAAAGPQNLKLRKADLIQEITAVLAKDYLEPFDETKYACYISGNAPSSSNKPKKANYIYAHDLDLITYGRHMMKHLDAILFAAPSDTAVVSSAPIDMMIVENQISTLASRMKTLQGMLTQYFIMKHIPQIEFISASCKLKLFTDATTTHTDLGAEALCVDASTYADRKKSGIIVCRSLGEISRKYNSGYAKWMPVFENHKKKDDLADCFLQGLWRVHSAV
jgi:hypothetical protein